MSLTLSQRETSTFPLLGTQPVRNTKEENCHCIAAGGAVSDSDTLFGGLQKIDRLLVVFTSHLSAYC